MRAVCVSAPIDLHLINTYIYLLLNQLCQNIFVDLVDNGVFGSTIVLLLPVGVISILRRGVEHALLPGVEL